MNLMIFRAYSRFIICFIYLTTLWGWFICTQILKISNTIVMCLWKCSGFKNSRFKIIPKIMFLYLLVFQLYDHDKDGILNFKETRKVLRCLGLRVDELQVREHRMLSRASNEPSRRFTLKNLLRHYVKQVLTHGK